MSAKPVVLEAQNLGVDFWVDGEWVMAAEGLNYSVRAGEVLAIVGESGSGKTTVSRCIGGLHREWTGRIVYRNEDLKLHARKRSLEQRLGIQYVFQNPYGSLNPRRTVRD